VLITWMCRHVHGCKISWWCHFTSRGIFLHSR